MRDHLTIAAQLVKAAKAGDSQAAADAEKRWANADEIATFLNHINPNWSKEDLTSMLYEHISLCIYKVGYSFSLQNSVSGVYLYLDIMSSLGEVPIQTQATAEKHRKMPIGRAGIVGLRRSLRWLRTNFLYVV